MSPVARAVLASWAFPPALVCGWLTYALLYLRGSRRLSFPAWRLAATGGGLAALALALFSPIDPLGRFLLTAHMLQHLLLLVVAPPLLLLGRPTRVLHHGWLAPFFAWPPLRRLQARPIAGAAILGLMTLVWHVPAPYELALRAPVWHDVEHACFFAAGLLFWSTVVHVRRPTIAIVLGLVLADVQNTLLSAVLVFSGRVIYPSYQAAPRLFTLSALDDQVAAGLIMWVPGSLVFVGPAVVLCIRWLSPAHRRRVIARVRTPRPPFDLLRVPLIGALIRRRRWLQAVCFIAAVAVIIDGLRGPAAAPMNLAGVLPWTFWRALTVLALLAAGNFFCMACPFMLPRELGRRLGRPTRTWPRALRSKWLAVGLLAAFFIGQEVFGWWDAPRATAFLVIAYFVSAFFVDTFVGGASFCKYVCPIGQFHFTGSLLSPLEVKVRLPTVCLHCETKDCLRGNAHQRGCELELYVPRKTGNLDCTFCLDCAKACPHDNIGILAVAPGHALLSERLAPRLDVAVLALVVVLAGFALAGVMVGALGPVSVGLLIAIGSLGMVAIALGRTMFCRFALALVPLGLGMWAAHLLFHLVSGRWSAWPVLQRMLGLGAPDWSLSCAGMAPPTLTTLELLVLDSGLLLSLYVGWRAIRTPARYLPFAAFATALWLAGVWILLSPMQMRGMLS